MGNLMTSAEANTPAAPGDGVDKNAWTSAAPSSDADNLGRAEISAARSSRADRVDGEKPWIRYFACTDDSPVGRVALSYLKALCRVARVRLCPLEVPIGPRWEPYAKLALTPMHGPYVNVVCAARSQWTWTQVVTMPKTENSPAGTAIDTIELYTAGVRNVLIAPSEPPEGDLWEAHRLSAMKYEAVIVPPVTLGRWLALRDVHEMSDATIDIAVLRSLILG
jgi:hypothetical protein